MGQAVGGHADEWVLPLIGGARAVVRATDRADGDLRIDAEPEELSHRRRALDPRPWVWLRQCHGADVVVLEPGAPLHSVRGAAADAVVTCRDDVVLAVHAADCGTVALAAAIPDGRDGGSGVVAAVHAGWRGLEAGVIEATVATMRALGAGPVQAVHGPCIGVECYAFGAEDLRRIAAVVGPSVVGRTRSGEPGLDLRGGVQAQLDRLDVVVAAVDPRCTACARPDGPGPGPAGPVATDALYSHRARADVGRHALLVGLDVHPGPGAGPGLGSLR